MTGSGCDIADLSGYIVLVTLTPQEKKKDTEKGVGLTERGLEIRGGWQRQS